jgi:hypothetical protein
MKEKIKRILALHHATVYVDEFRSNDLNFTSIKDYAGFVQIAGNEDYNWNNLVRFYKVEKDCPELAEIEEDTFLKEAYDNWTAGLKKLQANEETIKFLYHSNLANCYDYVEKVFLEAFNLTETPTPINNNFDLVQVGDIIFGEVLGGSSTKTLLVNTVELLKFNFNEYKDLLYINNTLYFEKISKIYRFDADEDKYVRII